MTTAFSYCVNFGKYSANISAFNPDTCHLFKTQDEAHTYGLKEVERLRVEAGSVVTSLEIEKFCVECDGRGFKVVKSGKRVIRRKEVKCQVCDGVGTELVSKEEF